LVIKGKDLSIPQVTLQAVLGRAVKNFSEKIAITYGNHIFTYYEIDEFSSSFAGALVNCGVEKGDVVALFLQNSPQFVIAYFGVLKAGAVVTSVNPLYMEREVEWQLCDSGAQTIIVLETLYPIIEKIVDRTLLKNVIVIGLNVGSKISHIRTSLNVLNFGDLIEKGVYRHPGLQFKPEEDLAVLQYTGGTTGVSKGVMLTHTNLVSNALSFASWLKGTSRDVFLSVLPFFHAYGMTSSMITPISLGAKMVLLPKFDPVKSLQVIEQCRVTVFCGSPTMYTMLLAVLEGKKYDLASVRVCISGASALLPHVQERFMQITGCLLVEGYGLTEASPITHCTPVDRGMDMVKVGSAGVPLPGTEARVVDLETGCNRVAVGERGELSVRGLQVMQGYWRRPDETARVLCGGWLLTGDVAYMDSEGYFYIVDRKKDLIKYKDYSVYPRELEEVLYEHPAVKLCAVIGKPDVLAGEIPKAFVMLVDGVKVTREEIMEFVNGKVASYKAIGEVEFCKELPISSSGKILRQSLREKL